MVASRSRRRNGTRVARINGDPAEAEEAVARAAELLAAARAPIILGLTDPPTRPSRQPSSWPTGSGRRSSRAMPRVVATDPRLSARGRVSATLGEVKNRADVVVFWGADPVETHPRHW